MRRRSPGTRDEGKATECLPPTRRLGNLSLQAWPTPGQRRSLRCGVVRAPPGTEALRWQRRGRTAIHYVLRFRSSDSTDLVGWARARPETRDGGYRGGGGLNATNQQHYNLVNPHPRRSRRERDRRSMGRDSSGTRLTRPSSARRVSRSITEAKPRDT